MTMTRGEIELFEFLDETRICTPWESDCDQEAEWLWTLTCCGFEVPLCAGHHLMALGQIDKEIRLGSYCALCGYKCAAGSTLHRHQRIK